MSQENLAGASFATFTAGADVTLGRALKLDSSGNVIHTTAITDQVVGIAMESALSGQPVAVATLSGQVVTAVGGAAITVGAEVMPTASGAGKLSTAAGATAISCGIAVSNPGADNGLFQVLLRPSVKSPANS
jgi:hypothetical protein